MPGQFYKSVDQIEQELSDFEIQNNPIYEGYLEPYNSIVASYNATILENKDLSLNVLVLFTKAELELLEEMRLLCIEYQGQYSLALMDTSPNEDGFFEAIANKYREAQEIIDNIEKIYGWNLNEKPLVQTEDFLPVVATIEELKIEDDDATLYCTSSLPANMILGVCPEDFALENAFSNMSFESQNDREDVCNMAFANIYIPTFFKNIEDSDEVVLPSLVGYTTTDINVDEDPVELRSEISFF